MRAGPGMPPGRSRRFPSRLRAVCFLTALVGVGLAAVAAPPSALMPGSSAGPSDVAVFEAVVANLRSGTSYYPAYGTALRRAGYPTRDAFNWRTPLWLSTIALLPETIDSYLPQLFRFGLLSAICIALSVCIHHSIANVIAAGMLVGALSVFAVPSTLVISEAWAGVLVGLSALAFTARRPRAGIALAILGLFVRELAAPYCVVCVLLSVTKRRWTELAGWMTGTLMYAVYYGWHLTQVWSNSLPTDFAHATSWLEFGGLPFLMSALGWHGWLQLLPPVGTVVVFVLIVAGIADSATPIHFRSASAAYIGFLFVAGKPFNHNWGLLAWPVWAVASGYGAAAVIAATATLGSRTPRSPHPHTGGPTP